MKKFLCSLMTAVMLFAAVPVYSVNVFAANNSVVAYEAPELVNRGETSLNYLYITPTSGISAEDCISKNAYFDITLDGGTFTGDVPEYYGPQGGSYNGFLEELVLNTSGRSGKEEEENAVIDSYNWLRYSNRKELPFLAEKISDTQMRIYLPAIPESAAGTSGVITGYGIPCLKIPVSAVVSGAKLTASTKSTLADYDGAEVTLAKTDASIKTETPKNAAWVNKIADLSKGSEIDGVRLVLTPRAAFGYDSTDAEDTAGTRSFVITVNNGKFTSAPIYDDCNYSYDSLMAEMLPWLHYATSERDKEQIIMDSYAGIRNNAVGFLPYKAELLNDRQLKVTLPPVPEAAIGESEIISQVVPAFGIPLPVKADGSEDVSIDVDFSVRAFRGDHFGAKIAVRDGSKPAVDSAILQADKVASIKANESYESNISVIPKNEIPVDTVLTVTAQSGTFDKDIETKAVSGLAISYDELMSEMEQALDMGESLYNAYAYYTDFIRSSRSDMPFKVERVSDTQLKIYLAPVPQCAVRNAGVITISSPYFSIPIMGTAANKDVKITVQSEFTDLMHSGLTIANVEGSQPDPEFKTGDADADGEITASDAAVILQKVLNSDRYNMPIESKTSDFMKYVDVDTDGGITATDASMVLQKVLDGGFMLPAEKTNN